MGKTGKAYFVDQPRVLDDLIVPHDILAEQNYEIIATAKLGKMDYENFVTDMIADRQFIEDNCELCSEGEVWKCLLVQQKGEKGGVLLIPTDRCYVKYAAYYSGD